MGMCGKGRDFAVKGFDNPRNTALFSCRLARKRWREVHAAAQQLVLIRLVLGRRANQMWSLAEGWQ